MARDQNLFKNSHTNLNCLPKPLLFKTYHPVDELAVLGEFFVDDAEEGDNFLHHLSQEGLI